jgi:hypothetical protein
MCRIGGSALDTGDHGRVRHIAGLATLQTVEPGFPFGPDAVRIGEVILVQILDEAGVATGNEGGLRELLDEALHGVGPGLWVVSLTD